MKVRTLVAAALIAGASLVPSVAGATTNVPRPFMASDVSASVKPKPFVASSKPRPFMASSVVIGRLTMRGFR